MSKGSQKSFRRLPGVESLRVQAECQHDLALSHLSV